MRILVTGGAGFIGSHLVERLVRDGHHVSVVDNLDDFYEESIKRTSLEEMRGRGAFAFHQTDIRDRQALESVFGAETPEAVVHMAARAGVRPSLADPQLYESINVGGTVNVLELARRSGVGRVVFASSSSVYGENQKIPFQEDDRTDEPISPYAATKRAGELLCYTYWKLYGLNITCIRIFTAHGSRCRPDLAVPKFVRLIEADKPIPMYGDGTSRRDYTYVGDTVDGLARALERCEGYRIYNLGSGRPVQLTEMIELVGQALGRQVRIERLPAQPGDVPATWADISRARRELGYQPSTPLADGVREYVAWRQRVMSGA